ncbi:MULTISPECIES: hypothetical protein [unclassified Streptomyces]|uniref:hypothetical protein n=1 Tax=unclassified Streptomyces TaxID=2593676 RepID=UPI00093B9232|nr:hypothetical protein [Streptomyces sp. TSRI0107]OKJ90720.1 hypothetical protein AMK31_03115 [Streptomyces sp. TSRI0107]
MAFTHAYGLRIGPWGLVARVSLDVQPLGEPPGEARRVDDSPVWWVPPPGLAPADEEWMRFGLGLVADQLGAVLVRVLAWDVPMLTDYQDEVAAAALIECLRDNCGIGGVDIGVTFDRERNRYEFTWGEGGERPEAGTG